MGAAIEALVVFLQRVPLLVADEHDAEIAEASEAGAQGPVVADGSVAVQFDEFVEDEVDVVAGLRPFAVPGHLHRFPGRQAAVLLALEADQLSPDLADLLWAPQLAVGVRLQPGQQVLQFVDFFLERQPLGGHGHTPCRYAMLLLPPWLLYTFMVRRAIIT